MADLMDFQNYGTPAPPTQADPNALTPEQLAAYQHQLSAFGLGERSKQIEEQMAQAQALMNNAPHNYGGAGWGAGLRGAINHAQGGSQLEALRAEQAKNLESERAVYGDNIKQAMLHPDDAKALGFSGAMTGSTGAPSLDTAGKAFSGGAGEMLRTLLSQQALKKGQIGLDQEERRNAALGDPDSPLNKIRGGLWTQLGGQALPEGATTQDLTDSEFGTQERLKAAEERAQAMRDVAGIKATSHRGGATDSTPDAVIDMWADAAASGQLPKRGQLSPGAQARVYARVAEKYPGINLAEVASGLHANQASLSEATKSADSMSRNEAKAEADLGILEDSIKGMRTTNSALLNTPIQAFERNTGDPSVVKFLTARQAAISQVSKTLAAGGSTVTEGLRHEAEDLIRKDYSPSQFAAAFQVLRQDMARNSAAMQKSVKDIGGRIGRHEATHESGLSVSEERVAPDGRVIQLMSDGSKRIKP